jgi:hypothetical protein
LLPIERIFPTALNTQEKERKEMINISRQKKSQCSGVFCNLPYFAKKEHQDRGFCMPLALSSNKMLVNTGTPIIKRAWTRFGLVMPGRKMLPYLMMIAPAMHPDASFQMYDISSGGLKLLPLSFSAPAQNKKFLRCI